MKLPLVEEPERYRGLYVYDFETWCALGYTAEEIAILLESEQYKEGNIYKIQRAWPAGRMELQGVSRERFTLESGMFFYRRSAEAAQSDFDQLCRSAEHSPPPARAYVHCAERCSADVGPRYVTALVYPAEYEAEFGQWLEQIAFAGGEIVEGGISHVTDYQQEEKKIFGRHQLWGASSHASRSADQVLAAVRVAVQR